MVYWELNKTYILFTCIFISQNDESSKLRQEITKFYQWFVGFSDAEGNFLISLDRNYVRFRFKISVHIDDIEVLNLIKTKLGVGIVIKENKNYCSFVVQDFYDIRDTICTIFLTYKLQTNKKLDFEDFYSAVVIKGDKGKQLTDIEREKILLIKDNMNFNRTIFIPNQSISINPNWLIGFLEGDGTLGIKNGSPDIFLQKILHKKILMKLF